MAERVTLTLTVTTLLIVDWLTFHDVFEPHTTRDYLTLVASLLVFFYLGLQALRARGVKA